VCGIAKPERFLESAAKTVPTVAASLKFRDHVRYDAGKIQKILTECRKHNVTQILTTEKDAVKLIRFEREFADCSVIIAVLPVTVTITSGKDDLCTALLSLIP
jgi:tetraacyldisaccharide-1-P 4'-kinase